MKLFIIDIILSIDYVRIAGANSAYRNAVIRCILGVFKYNGLIGAIN